MHFTFMKPRKTLRNLVPYHTTQQGRIEDSTPCRPKGSPFDTFSEIHFWQTDPKIFLKAPSAPIYTNFEGERAAFWLFFSKICLRRRKFSQSRGKTVLWESSKNQFGRPKKKVVKILEIFLKIRPPPLEKILDPPLPRNEIKFRTPQLSWKNHALYSLRRIRSVFALESPVRQTSRALQVHDRPLCGLQSSKNIEHLPTRFYPPKKKILSLIANVLVFAWQFPTF